MILPSFFRDSHGAQSATLFGGSGLALSTLTPHLDHTVQIVNFLLHAFDGMARFGGAALIVIGWINHYLAYRKTKRPESKSKVILP